MIAHNIQQTNPKNESEQTFERIQLLTRIRTSQEVTYILFACSIRQVLRASSDAKTPDNFLLISFMFFPPIHK